MELSKTQLKLAKNQFYLTKLLYHSLEVMRRIMKYFDKNKIENTNFAFSPEIGQKIDSYFKIKENLKSKNTIN